MTDLPEQDLWIGSVMQQNIYLHWQDVKDICTKEVSKAYEQTKEENDKLKELLKECRDEIEYLRKHYKGNIDHLKNNTRLDKEINQALGEDK